MTSLLYTPLQIKQYSYSHNGSKPQSWPENNKGSVQCSGEGYYGQLYSLMNMSILINKYISVGFFEYAAVSLSLSLVIAKFFPAVHNKIVLRVTRVEHQSLYWGTVIVSNIFTYGLLFLARKGWSLLTISHPAQYILVILEVVFNTILLVGALIASCKGHGGTGVPVPNGIVKICIYISFLFSCFCCCVGCSVYCKKKTLRVLVLFSFMSFIYHSLLDVISVTLLLFIEETRASTATFTLLYISLLIFLVLFASFTLLTLIQRNVSGWHQCLNCFGGAFLFITVFVALMLLIIMYITAMFSLKLQGVSGIVTGLIPSIVLSFISWYIKKKFFTRKHTTGSTNSDMGHEPGISGGAENDKLEDNDRMLLP